MTHTEAPFSVTFKTARGDLLTTRGADIQEFRSNVRDVLRVKEDLDAGRYPATVPDANGEFAQAEQNLRDGGLVASSVGQAPQRESLRAGESSRDSSTTIRVVPNPSQTQSAPPDENYPGDCAHGPRQYVDKPAKGRPWRRWECNKPWHPGADPQTLAYNKARCTAVNA